MSERSRQPSRFRRRASALLAATLSVVAAGVGAAPEETARSRQIPVRLSPAAGSHVRIVSMDESRRGPTRAAAGAGARVRVGAGVSISMPVDLGRRRSAVPSARPSIRLQRPGPRVGSPPSSAAEIRMADGQDVAPNVVSQRGPAAPSRGDPSGRSQRSLYEQLLGDVGSGSTAPQVAESTGEFQAPSAPSSAAFPPRPQERSGRVDMIPRGSGITVTSRSSRPANALPGVATVTGAAAGSTYRLGPGDVVDIFVWRNAELTREVPVRPDGRISMPLVGELQAAGRTTDELRDDIVERLSAYVQVPEVSVSVAQINSLVVYVLGNVASPGPQVLDRYANVLQALSMAGGLNEFANKGDITILRTVGGRQVRIEFDYSEVVEGKHPEMNVQLRAGDIIYVP